MSTTPQPSHSCQCTEPCAIPSLPRRIRNYGFEYRKRIERGQARNFTRRQARGHPAPNELSVLQVERLARAQTCAVLNVLYPHEDLLDDTTWKQIDDALFSALASGPDEWS